ncbi:hypothetical protein DFH06DRAFT_1017486, partial [Mycena polygramma]
NVDHKLANLVELSLLLKDANIRDIAAFQNAIFESFSPKMFAYCENAMDLIFKHEPDLRREYPGAFAGCEFNLGDLGSAPRIHDRDLLHGWRALTALGKYDARYGGDLVLWDKGLIVRFPPGTTILFPAALMRYSFVGVRDGEAQYHFAQFCSGGLFRYILNGYVNDALYESNASRREMAQMDIARRRRLDASVKMFSTIGEYINTT